MTEKKTLFYAYKMTCSSISDKSFSILCNKLPNVDPIYIGHKVLYKRNFIILLKDDDEIVYHTPLSRYPMKVAPICEKAMIHAIVMGHNHLEGFPMDDSLEYNDFLHYMTFAVAQRYWEGNEKLVQFDGMKPFIMTGYWFGELKRYQPGEDYIPCMYHYLEMAQTLLAKQGYGFRQIEPKECIHYRASTSSDKKGGAKGNFDRSITLAECSNPLLTWDNQKNQANHSRKEVESDSDSFYD